MTDCCCPWPPRDAAEDWKRFDAHDIPSKGIHHLPPIFYETLLDQVVRHNNKRPTLHILELGCGCGDLSLHLLEVCLNKSQEVSVVGTDINAGAIEAAKSKAKSSSRAHFFVSDVNGDSFVDHVREYSSVAQFDFVVLQLLLSIVGTPKQRQSTLQNAFHLCRPGGMMYLSCSGVSGDINSKYAELYEKDFAATGEKNTYFSRGKAKESLKPHQNNAEPLDDVLYTTHHFETKELSDLLKETGFDDIRIEQKQETSSRRPEESAYFLYATARRPI